jgi:type 1 glutamine amidotransferase
MRIAKVVLSLLAAVAIPASAVYAEDRIAVIVGPSKHPVGTHEAAAGGRLMQWALEHMANVKGVKADLYSDWPQAESAWEGVKAVVFIGDGFPPEKFPGRESNLAAVAALAKRGVGIVCVHYATGLNAEAVPPDGSHPLLGWTGGYFAVKNQHHQSVAKVFQNVTFSPAAASHPVSKGWREFTIDEEPYYNNYFGPDNNKPANNVTIFATAMLPPEAPRREAVAWGIQRPDGGRGFAVVMPHFFRNWANEDLRRLILNGIVWSARLSVPPGGVSTPTPELAKFEPESVEPKPRPSTPGKN